MKQNKPQGAVAPTPDEQIEFVHLYIRGNYRQDIFFDKVDFINAWNRIWLSARATGVKIYACEILSNHFHTVVGGPRMRKKDGENCTKPGRPWLSNYVHHLRMSLSYYFNKRYDVHGSLGSRRYGSANVIAIEEDGGDDLRDLIRYINRNVKHHGISDNYQNWPYSTFNFVFELSKSLKKNVRYGKDIPENLKKAYLPATCELPSNWGMTPEGLLIPPEGVFPHTEIEKLFGSLANYLKACDTRTIRESKSEAHEEKLGRTPNRTTDQQIINFIEERSLIPIVTMNKKQLALAAKAVQQAIPNVSIRQLSRILHLPASTLKYILAHS